MKKLYLFVLCVFLVSSSKAQIISTFAGTGAYGFSGDSGFATSAKLYGPFGIAVDKFGDVYFADNINSRIRKVNAAGIITTVAGNGTNGFSGDGGAAVNASLSSPRGIAFDASGNLFIADFDNNRIRKVSTSGIITTIAGIGTLGGYSGDGGPATSATLNSPWDVAADSLGNVYIADQRNNRIRMVNPGGIITTFAGNGNQSYSGDGGQAINAALFAPYGVALDRTGNLYIADGGNSRIRKVNTSGIISTVAGNGTTGFSGDGGPATIAELYYPMGVEVDNSGVLYIIDDINNRIRKVDANNVITTFAGNGAYGYTGDGGLAVNAEFNYMKGVAVDNLNNLYIADQNNNVIRKIADINSVQSQINNDKVFIMPNPASNILNIELQDTSDKEQIKITDLLGKDVTPSVLRASHPKREKNIAIDVNSFANGVYFISISNGTSTSTQKFIVQH